MKKIHFLSLMLIISAIIGFNSCQEELTTEDLVTGYTVLLDESADTKAYVSNSGTVSGTGTYTHGSNVSLSTTAQKIQYRKESTSTWSTSTGSSYTINAIDANYYVRPWTQYYTVSVSGGTGGGDVKSGGSCSINAPSSSDPSGKTFDKWTISGTGSITSSGSRSTTVTGVGSDCTVTANFKATTPSKTTVYARAELVAESGVDASSGNGWYSVRVWLSTDRGLSSDVNITGACTILLDIATNTVTLNSISSGEATTRINKNSTNYPGLLPSNAGGKITIKSFTLPSSYTSFYTVSII